MPDNMTQGEKIELLYQRLIGNGTGLYARFEDHERREDVWRGTMDMKLDALTTDVAHIRGELKGHMATAKPKARTITLRRIGEVAATAIVLGLIAAGVLLLLVGKLTPENIVDIIEAVRQ